MNRWSLLIRAGGLALLSVTAPAVAGCPTEMVDPDADIDAFRVRRDAGPDTMEDTAADTAEPIVMDDTGRLMGTDAYTFDAGPVDAGPIPQCMGVTPPEPSMACRTSDDCTARGMANCIFAYPTGECSIFGMMLTDECMTDDDCDAVGLTDALVIGPDDDAFFSDEDAGTPRMDAGPPPDLQCVVRYRMCPWPERRCEPRCTGPTCPNARCDGDGYMCPTNAACEPSSPSADGHGCAPKSCVRNEDCDCGYCTPFGLCANGAGRCE